MCNRCSPSLKYTLQMFTDHYVPSEVNHFGYKTGILQLRSAHPIQTTNGQCKKDQLPEFSAGKGAFRVPAISSCNANLWQMLTLPCMIQRINKILASRDITRLNRRNSERSFTMRVVGNFKLTQVFHMSKGYYTTGIGLSP